MSEQPAVIEINWGGRLYTFTSVEEARKRGFQLEPHAKPADPPKGATND